LGLFCRDFDSHGDIQWRKVSGPAVTELVETDAITAELIICDDTSSDATVDIIRRFSETAPFSVKLVVNEQRLGWRSNFLKAASLCVSEYIAYCDQDDIWLPDKLAIVQSHLEKKRPLLLQHGYRTIDSTGALISGPLTYEHLASNDPWVHSYGLNQVFHRSLVEFFDLWELSKDHFHANEKMAHDQFVFFLSSLLGQTVTIKNVLLYYRQHGNNVVGFIAAADHGGVGRSLLRTLDRVRDRDAGANKRKYVLGTLRGRTSAAIARQTMTEKVISRLPENRAQELLPKLRYYENHVRYLSARLLAYEGPSRAQRAAAMLSALGKGWYKDAGGTGARDIGADLLYGVFGSKSPTARDP
jgi:glycosyltransferase involved in cell wall biosynthesis